MGLFNSVKKVVGGGAKILTGNPMGGFADQWDGVSSAMPSDLKSMIPGIGDSMAQDKANKINIQQAELNRQFQERMSSTAYQRAMADMKKAGLNPTLAYMQGGASSPSGATATVESAPKTALADMALKATTGIGGLQTQRTAVQQQQAMNESTIQLQASTAAKQAVEAQKIQAETKGLGKKEEEGKLWSKFYKGVNSILDSSAKDAAKRNKNEPPLIKKLGPASKSESKMFNWLRGSKPNS